MLLPALQRDLLTFESYQDFSMMMSEQLKLQLNVFGDEPNVSTNTGETDAEMAARLQAELLQDEEVQQQQFMEDEEAQQQEDDVLVKCYHCEGMCKVPVTSEQVICPFCQKTNAIPPQVRQSKLADWLEGGDAADAADTADADAAASKDTAPISPAQVDQLEREHKQEELLSSVLFSTEWDLQCKISDTLLYAADQGTTSKQEEKMLDWANSVRKMQELVLEIGDSPTMEQMQRLHDFEAELQREQVKAEMELERMVNQERKELQDGDLLKREAPEE